MTKQTKFIIVVGIQAAILAVIVISKLMVLSTGSEVLLRIQPVDPRDPLRGDYVAFQYDISRPYYYDAGSFEGGETVYVTLYRQGKFWEAQKVYRIKPSSNQILFIKGNVTRRSLGSGPKTLSVTYGIEQYFIPEGTGVSSRFTGRNNYAKVVIDQDGNSVLKQIYIDGESWP